MANCGWCPERSIRSEDKVRAAADSVVIKVAAASKAGHRRRLIRTKVRSRVRADQGQAAVVAAAVRIQVLKCQNRER